MNCLLTFKKTRNSPCCLSLLFKMPEKFSHSEHGVSLMKSCPLKFNDTYLMGKCFSTKAELSHGKNQNKMNVPAVYQPLDPLQEAIKIWHPRVKSLKLMAAFLPQLGQAMKICLCQQMHLQTQDALFAWRESKMHPT
ncbi:hypothetical protein Y1Q_0001010 [Alligator mississippiensis]|uniref:Uncharacterized protein n=1 Tax=Alligator mississippiensis TaxID=8496 RepID=A0A151NEB3_ALLMI|nr:hypothetical protein Y1Q_0001010 [Alligator mississippiensis]